MPAPVCKSGVFNFDSMDRITAKSKYLGDSSKTDWVMDGEAILFNGNVLLTMAPDTVGTLLASSTYMWYGNVKAKFKTSRGAGVVTAFILLSDVKDEIDYEFVGVDLGVAQTNYYFQGITNCKFLNPQDRVALANLGFQMEIVPTLHFRTHSQTFIPMKSIGHPMRLHGRLTGKSGEPRKGQKRGMQQTISTIIHKHLRVYNCHYGLEDLKPMQRAQ